MSDPLASLVDSLLVGLRHIQVTRFSELASSSIIIFDHLLTLDDEINLIWNSSWSLGKVLFILNRYYSLSAVVFNNYGLRFFHWQGWTGLIGSMLAEGILQIRLYALYSLNKKVLALMLTCYIAALTISAWIIQNALSHFTAVSLTLPAGGKFCVPSNVPKNIYAFWIPMLAFESLLCLLAVIRGFQTFKSNGSLFHNGRQLVGILIRDSLMYFFVIFATYLTCVLVWILAPVTLLEVPVGFSIAMSCVLGNRVVLNVRAVSREVEATSGRQHTSQKHLTQRSVDISLVNVIPGTTISDIEMGQLRSMKAKTRLGKVVVEKCDRGDEEESNQVSFIIL